MRTGWHSTAMTLARAAAARDKRAEWAYTEHTRTYGVLIIKAFTVDTTAVRRAATENNFILRCTRRFRQVGGEQPHDCRQGQYPFRQSPKRQRPGSQTLGVKPSVDLVPDGSLLSTRVARLVWSITGNELGMRVSVGTATGFISLVFLRALGIGPSQLGRDPMHGASRLSHRQVATKSRIPRPRRYLFVGIKFSSPKDLQS